LHRCLQRHGISRLPEIEGDKPAKKQKFKSYPAGYFHVDIAEVRTEEGKLRLFVAIDRTSTFVYALLHLLPRGFMRKFRHLRAVAKKILSGENFRHEKMISRMRVGD
jgi:hypothetical protein